VKWSLAWELVEALRIIREPVKRRFSRCIYVELWYMCETVRTYEDYVKIRYQETTSESRLKRLKSLVAIVL
jgi:hypothetical protein